MRVQLLGHFIYKKMVRQFIIKICFNSRERFLIKESLLESKERKERTMSETCKEDALKLFKLSILFSYKYPFQY